MAASALSCSSALFFLKSPASFNLSSFSFKAFSASSRLVFLSSRAVSIPLSSSSFSSWAFIAFSFFSPNASVASRTEASKVFHSSLAFSKSSFFDECTSMASSRAAKASLAFLAFAEYSLLLFSTASSFAFFSSRADAAAFCFSFAASICALIAFIFLDTRPFTFRMAAFTARGTVRLMLVIPESCFRLACTEASSRMASKHEKSDACTTMRASIAHAKGLKIAT
mmetsp:Transcript_34035/g.55870  ORF Transcript_34035/g.55870 Transcript_34035/m.55870 type:complete len:225 (-) Transcript_34035:18-692(-)